MSQGGQLETEKVLLIIGPNLATAKPSTVCFDGRRRGYAAT